MKLIPAAPLTEAALPTEIEHMIKALRAGLGADDLADADRVLAKYAGDSTALANAAAVAWVQRSPGAALLLATEAARAGPGDANSLNTLGALLANAGYGHKAIPLLRYLVQRYPDDPTLLNNLGQAWFALGEIGQAEPLLKRSVALAPRLGAAHASLGVLAQSRGDQAGATAHYQAAVSANYSPTARAALDRQDTRYRLPRSFAEFLAAGEYFNPGHFVPPRPPRRGEEGKMKHREQEAFDQYLSGKIQTMEAQKQTAKAAGEKIIKSDPIRAMTMVHSPTPMAALATLASLESWLDGQEVIDNAIKRYKSNIARLEQEKNANIEKIDDESEKTADKNTSDSTNAAEEAAAAKACRDRKAATDTYLRACAEDYEQMELVVLPRLRDRTNTALACLAITSSGPFYQEAFADAVNSYFYQVSELAGRIVIEEVTCKESFLAGNGKKPEGEIPRLGDCPIHASLDLVVVTLKADCRTFGFEFKAGLEFSATKDFISGETTLTAGIATPEMTLGRVVSGGGSMAFVIIWDQNNNLSYVGVETEGHAAAGPIAKFSSKSSLGVTIGPQGVDPDIRGAAAAEVLGHEIFEAKI